MKLLILCLILVLFTPANADTISPFHSDGCSGFIDGTLSNQQLWLSCCIDHDTEYWQGGSYQQRLISDINLKHCVSAVGEPLIGQLMFAAVRVGGSPYWPSSFRWGFGWPYPHGYPIQGKQPTQTDNFIKIGQLLVIIILALFYLGQFIVRLFAMHAKPIEGKSSLTKHIKPLLVNAVLSLGLFTALLIGPAAEILLILLLFSTIIIALFKHRCRAYIVSLALLALLASMLA